MPNQAFEVLRATAPLFPLLTKQEIEAGADNALENILERVKLGRAA